MKLLITGCAGFIGANFTEYILDNYTEDTVVGVDCLTYAANAEALANLRKSSRFCFYKVNICDASAIEEVFAKEKPDIVVNFAAESHVDRSIDDSAVFVQTNVLGTQVLLDAAYRHGVKRFHQVSTDEVYGDLPIDSDDAFSENDPLRPSSPYSASKAAADLLALSYAKTHGLPVSISRSSNNFGKYQHTEKLIPKVITRLLNNEPVELYGDGQNVRDWIYVGDNCSAIDTVIRCGKPEIYNIGVGNCLSNLSIVKTVAEKLERRFEIRYVADRKGHDRKYAVCIDRLLSLGWQNRSDFSSSLSDTVKWYKERILLQNVNK